MTQSRLFLVYGRSLPCEVYYELLSDAEGNITGVRASDTSLRLVIQKDAQYILTSGCQFWRELCDQCGINKKDEVLQKHREKYGIVSMAHLLEFASQVWGERITSYEDLVARIDGLKDDVSTPADDGMDWLNWNEGS